MTTPKKWNELGSRTRRLIMVGAAIDGALRAAALADLARRPPAEVRGSKVGWGVALTLVSSAGVLPACYLLRGRRGPS